MQVFAKILTGNCGTDAGLHYTFLRYSLESLRLGHLCSDFAKACSFSDAKISTGEGHAGGKVPNAKLPGK
jgi:hypothetical protein